MAPLFAKQRRHLVSVCIVCFLCFFWCDCSAMVRWIFTKHSPTDIFVVLFVNVGTPWKLIPEAQNVYFFGFFLHWLWTATAWKRGEILGKLKQLRQLRYLGYRRVHIWWNSDYGHLSYRGLINCTFWLMHQSASLDWQYFENGNIYKITSGSLQKAESMAFPTVYPFCGFVPPFPKFLSLFT